jgi:hypothetical protein
MPPISQKLHYKKAGVINDIELYDTTDDVGAQYLVVMVNGAAAYAKLGSVGDPSASDMRIQKNGTTYAVCKVAEQELPSGFIAMFEGACPIGWTREASFDNYFLRGAAAYDSTPQGTESHQHTFSPGTVTTSASTESADKIDTNNDAAFNPSGHVHEFSVPGTASDDKSPLPPYINVVFCRKN